MSCCVEVLRFDIMALAIKFDINMALTQLSNSQVYLPLSKLLLQRNVLQYIDLHPTCVICRDENNIFPTLWF